MSEHIYELKQPFEYAYKGEMVDAKFITLLPPTSKHISDVTPIKQAVTSAIIQAQKNAEGVSEPDDSVGEDQGLTANDVKAIMYQWDGDLSKVFLYTKELFKIGVALVEGNTKLTSSLIDKISLDDFENLTWEYINHFLAPSLMSGE